MKLLKGFFGLIYIMGYIGNGLLFLYIEWLYIREDLIQIINPLLHFQVIFTLLKTPLFWILIVVTLLGFFASRGAEAEEKNNEIF
ncbi:MAG: hypothetical protein ACOX27_03045 [Caldicoprobacterales bacterium]